MIAGVATCLGQSDSVSSTHNSEEQNEHDEEAEDHADDGYVPVAEGIHLSRDGFAVAERSQADPVRDGVVENGHDLRPAEVSKLDRASTD